MNYSISLNLKKMPGIVTNLKGKKSVKPCYILPLDTPGVFISQDGTPYLDLNAIETPDNKYGNSHMVKVSVPKDVYDSLSEEERKAVHGNMRPFKSKAQPTASIMIDDENEDLPF